MKQIVSFSIFIIFLSTSVNTSAQNSNSPKDTLWYLNGDYELISDYQFTEEGRILNYSNKKGKRRDIETYFVFSINKTDGTREILYKPNMDEEGDTLSVAEMEAFVKGGHYANTEYKAPFKTLEGFAVGAASPFLIQAIGLHVFYSIALPGVNSTVVGVTKPIQSKIKEKYPVDSRSPIFIEGYQEAAKRKRTKNSIKGGVLGLAAGIITVIAISSAN